MSLFLRRVYPDAEDPNGVVVLGLDLGLGGGVDVLRSGLTIRMSNEPDEPVAESPYIARFNDDFRRVVRVIMERLFEGYQIEVRPGLYWSLMRNPALAAELGADESEGAVLLMEKRGDRKKQAPDALYRLSRLNEHDYLRDLLERARGAGSGGDSPGGASTAEEDE